VQHTIIVFDRQFTMIDITVLLLVTRPEAPVDVGTEALAVITGLSTRDPRSISCWLPRFLFSSH